GKLDNVAVSESNGTYTVTTTYADADSSDVVASLKAGDTVTTGNTTYTAKADGSFEKSVGSGNQTAAHVAGAITNPASGETKAAEITLNGTTVNVLIKDDGSLTDLDGQALSLVTDANSISLALASDVDATATAVTANVTNVVGALDA